ncbi:chordin isoform X2 [Scleropages formosus]|uniref:chordin isoform X2 n=1 Tax=Scleropages formosus TaxID=113540 RepID=UPI0010FAA60D|nr:chordin isoform X2 [Scleropages formosus]
MVRATQMDTVRALLALCALGCAWAHLELAPRLKTPPLPIQSEKEPLPSKGLSGCSFGGRFYSLEDSWHPDLGDPFGIMHCVQCRCEPRSRKGKLLGKVSCRNTKQDCPEPSCTNPVSLPGRCCRTCAQGEMDREQEDFLLDTFEFLHEKEGDLHKSYNDGSYLSSEDVPPREGQTDFVALLTAVPESRPPVSSGVARARLSLSGNSLVFSITFLRMDRPSRVLIQDSEGNVVFQFRVSRSDLVQNGMICGVWKNVPKSQEHLLQAEQLRVSMTTGGNKQEEIQGRIVKHRALFAETFSAVLTSEEEHSGMGGMAMLTLSDTENNLHFILLFQGLLQGRGTERPLVPIRVQLRYRQLVLREVRANVTAHDPDFAEVLDDLNSRELFWLSRGQLEIAVETEDSDPRRISGFVSGRKSCDTIQSVMSSGDALTPGKTGAVGSAIFSLHDNGSLDYQVQVAGVSSQVVGVTVEMKPRRRSKRSVLHDLSGEYAGGRAAGRWGRMEARHIHMLLQNELFVNVATVDHPEGELRGQIRSLLYGGPHASRDELPVLLGGQLVSPPVATGAGGHAWVSVDEKCHLHYEIVVSGLSKSEDSPVDAHLHASAEIGELDRGGPAHKRLLTSFYGSQAQGVLKDLSAALLRHLDRGTAFVQVSTKQNPRGEIRGRVSGDWRRNALPSHGRAAVPCQGCGDVRPGSCRLLCCLFPRQYVALAMRAALRIFSARPLSAKWFRQPFVKNAGGSGQRPGGGLVSVATVGRRPTARPRSRARNDGLSASDQVRAANGCRSGSGFEAGEPGFDDETEEPKRDPRSCFFEGQHHAHGSRWTPHYNNCFACSCKKKTVICDPIICPTLSCTHTIQPEDECCPVCHVETMEPRALDVREAVEEHPEGCYFEGDQKLHAPGTTWHPFVPPFGYIKCAVCTCKGSTGEVHCEKVTCPPLACGQPVRRSPSDCCKVCPGEGGPPPPPPPHAELMQADGSRHCRFGKTLYQDGERWHPHVSLVGEMKCITCWCDNGVTKCQRQQCPVLTCHQIIHRRGGCCPECEEASTVEEENLMILPEKKSRWRH